jgi:16S rRNA (adenine1518-N6/adenine1519-N6)-dimethyltransferase
MIAPKKSLGQHFLRDENVARKIVHELDLQPRDVVVEIGPGTGALTKHLAPAARTVVGIEVDPRAVLVLRSMFGDAVDVLERDVLTVDLTELAQRHRTALRVVGNIPYNITSAILFWLFEHRTAVRDATLMMQLEVARRLVARPKTKAYGILSVATQFHAVPELLFKVSRNSFYPTPEVDSAILRLRFEKEVPPCNVSLFTALVRATFGKRRKTLRNSLRYMGLSDEQLKGITLDLVRRPEELSLEEFINLARQLEPYHASIFVPFHDGRT